MTENVNVVERANVIKKVDVVDNDFLKLVDEHYDEKDLVEWEPAPPPVSRPDEPGNLGMICRLGCKFSSRIVHTLSVWSGLNVRANFQQTFNPLHTLNVWTIRLERSGTAKPDDFNEITKLKNNSYPRIGAAVVVPPELQEASKERFGENEFDVVANEMMSVNRTLTDSRYPE